MTGNTDTPSIYCWLRGHRWAKEVLTQASIYEFYHYRECKHCGKREAFS